MSGDANPNGASGKPGVNPGDAAPAGTPGTGENVCPDCKGSGRLGNVACQTCGGTGKVIEGISGA
jgi:DnaJ-class molecular chaperone